MVKIGAHVSAAGGYTNALLKAREIGAGCMQIFSSSPRIWKMPSIADDQIQEFLTMKQQLLVDPIYFHASYLINLGGDERLRNLSKESLIFELSLAEKMGIVGTIIHIGSYKEAGKEVPEEIIKEKYKKLILVIQEILAATPENTFLILENAGSRKIGMRFEELGTILHDVGSKRVKICIDTCHAHAAGYKFSTGEDLDEFLNDFNMHIGLENLEVFQINDSKDPVGSFRDRHENIGEGMLGIKSFDLLVNHPRTKNIPFILEVPGFEKKGPDRKNIEILKSLIA